VVKHAPLYYRVDTTLTCNESKCGYNSEARARHWQAKKRRVVPSNPQTDSGDFVSGPPVAITRNAPYNDTGCLAHAEITWVPSTGLVKRIVGLLDHNTECQNATLVRLPSIPLHPEVIALAQQQLIDGIRCVTNSDSTYLFPSSNRLNLPQSSCRSA
jgi:hypothetical protein